MAVSSFICLPSLLFFAALGVDSNVGDRVPADLRIVEAVNLQIDESSLTGEPHSRNKNSAVLREPTPLADRSNCALLSTLVRAGHGKVYIPLPPMRLYAVSQMDWACKRTSCWRILLYSSPHTHTHTHTWEKALVVASADQSEFGLVFQLMKDTTVRETPLQVIFQLQLASSLVMPSTDCLQLSSQVKMQELGKHLSQLSLGIIAVIVLIGVIQGRKLQDMFTIGERVDTHHYHTASSAYCI